MLFRSGLYQEMYDDDYRITTTVVNAAPVTDLDAYKAALPADVLETYEITADDISAAQMITTQAALADGTVIATLDVYVVQIGNTWYVDNLTTNTNTFYAGQLAGIAA